MSTVGLGSVGLVGPARAWAPLTVAGQAVRWDAEQWPLPLATTQLTDRRAAAAWSAAGPACFVPTTPTELAPDGVVAVQALGEAAWAQTVGDAGLVAFTLVTHAGDALVDADVVLNSARYPLATDGDPRRYQRETVVAHELGHALGLGHPCGDAGQPECDEDTAEALMAPRLAPGRVVPLGVDDQAGLAAVADCRASALRAPNAEWAGRGWRAPAPAAGLAGAWDAGGAWHRLAVADDAVAVPRWAVAYEVWSAEGKGVVQALPEPPPAAEGGCMVRPGLTTDESPAGLGAWLGLALVAGALGRRPRPPTRELS